MEETVTKHTYETNADIPVGWTITSETEAHLRKHGEWFYVHDEEGASQGLFGRAGTIEECIIQIKDMERDYFTHLLEPSLSSVPGLLRPIQATEAIFAFYVVGPHLEDKYTVQTKREGAGLFLEGEYVHETKEEAQRVADIANKAIALYEDVKNSKQPSF